MVTTRRNGPTLVRRTLGRRLRTLREQTGKTMDDVVASGVMSASKLYRVETGRGSVRPGDVLMLARLYGRDDREIEELVELAEATKATGFTQDYGAVPRNIGIHADIEAGSAAVASYNSELVTGLIQSPGYVRAIMERAGLPEDEVEQRVEFRLRRQRAFFDRPSPGLLEAAITAGALGVQVGSPAVMDEQRRHLVELARRDQVDVLVLPAERGHHTAMRGPFTIFDFDDPEFAPVVYVENLIGSRYIERPDFVARFRSAFDVVRSQSVSIEEFLQ